MKRWLTSAVFGLAVGLCVVVFNGVAQAESPASSLSTWATSNGATHDPALDAAASAMLGGTAFPAVPSGYRYAGGSTGTAGDLTLAISMLGSAPSKGIYVGIAFSTPVAGVYKVAVAFAVKQAVPTTTTALPVTTVPPTIPATMPPMPTVIATVPPLVPPTAKPTTTVPTTTLDTTAATAPATSVSITTATTAAATTPSTVIASTTVVATTTTVEQLRGNATAEDGHSRLTPNLLALIFFVLLSVITLCLLRAKHRR